MRLPETRGLRPADQDVKPAGWARVSFVRDLPDGRRFANDSRGFLYLLDRQQPALGLRERRRRLPARRLQPAGERVHRLRLPSGVRAERAVLHGARRARDGQSRDAELHPAGIHAGGRDLSQRHHRVARHQPGGEHVRGHPARAAARRPRRRQPDASVRPRRVQPDGEARDARLRPALHERQRSGVQQRRRTAREQSQPDAASRLGHRRHPAHRSAQSVGVRAARRDSGDYTIPPANKFAADGDPKTLGEIYAYGFRNAHRLSWDLTDGTMFASDIGMNHIEEINIVRNGDNYGWMKREGLLRERHDAARRRAQSAVPAAGGFLNGRRKTNSPIRSRSTTTTKGRRSRGGFAYHGRIAALRGKFVFGDVAARPPLRGRPGGDEEGRRRDSADRGADRRNPALRARRRRQSHRT